ncbi:MAG: hypothetical protein ACI4VG_03560 [Lachnospiraceae bacterium]
MKFMDLLFSRYASPLDFMKLYIEQGRFGEFVEEIIEMDNERRREAEEKENDDKLWQAYIRSGSDKSFIEWKHELTHIKEERASLSMTDTQVENAKVQARGILKGFSPSK